MKKTDINVIAGSILFVFFAMNSFGQTTATNTKEGGKKPGKLEKNKVPKEVMNAYAKEFSSPPFANWYGYPAINDQDWYDSDPYLYSTEFPENYVVEYSKDHIPYRSVYSKNGEKIATHRKLTSNLPKAVLSSISKGEYKEWKLGNDKEEIFKDKDSDKLKVYKVEVEKGKEKHWLFFQSDGKLLKDKKVP